MEKTPTVKELVDIYNRALSSGNTGAAEMATKALRATAKAEAVTVEARRLAILANEM
jgi:hypothetical protein